MKGSFALPKMVKNSLGVRCVSNQNKNPPKNEVSSNIETFKLIKKHDVFLDKMLYEFSLQH